MSVTNLRAAAPALEHDLPAVERLELGPMADADDRGRVELVGQQLHQFVLALGIERRGGLVQHDDVGPMQQDPRERESLLLAARERLVPGRFLVEPIDQVAEPDGLDASATSSISLLSAGSG